MAELDDALQQRERIVGIPRALASEASIKIKQAAAGDCYYLNTIHSHNS